MTSYLRSCSDEIGRFCDLSHKGARSCFPAYEYEFHESLLVFMDAHVQLNQGQGHARLRFIGAFSR